MCAVLDPGQGVAELAGQLGALACLLERVKTEAELPPPFAERDDHLPVVAVDSRHVTPRQVDVDRAVEAEPMIGQFKVPNFVMTPAPAAYRSRESVDLGCRG